ncbi:alanine:cation symporter family protein [Pilosibacter sp. HC1M1C21]|uniref:alanine:cation symporter family protein n=1 Tax=Pilosibacter sp. HC1M1C21 TaxID=3378803 RepID=UPI00385BA574
MFFDTIVSCTLTALVILCVAGRGAASESGAENGASLTSLCFFTALGSPGGYLVAVCVVLFAFSTIIAWYYMGRQAAEYLGGKISGRIPAIYTAGYLLAAFLGCLGAMETVWQVTDIFNGLMAVPNLAALVLLVGEIDAPGEKERDTGKRETAE